MYISTVDSARVEWRCRLTMSANGTTQTSRSRLDMSVSGGEAVKVTSRPK